MGQENILNMIPFLGPEDPFPPVERALVEPDGLLAAGGGLSVRRLVDAYSRGIFPWFNEGDPILWWSPDPRMVAGPARSAHFPIAAPAAAPARLHGDGGHGVRRRARRLRGSTRWRGRHLARARDAACLRVAAPRGFRPLNRGLDGRGPGRRHLRRGPWPDVLRRVDVLGPPEWFEDCDRPPRCTTRPWGFPLIDCQLETEHLSSLGASLMPRAQFVREVARLVQEAPTPPVWSVDVAGL